jgi:hypothetical protein
VGPVGAVAAAAVAGDVPAARRGLRVRVVEGLEPARVVFRAIVVRGFEAVVVRDLEALAGRGFEAVVVRGLEALAARGFEVVVARLVALAAGRFGVAAFVVAATVFGAAVDAARVLEAAATLGAVRGRPPARRVAGDDRVVFRDFDAGAAPDPRRFLRPVTRAASSMTSALTSANRTERLSRFFDVALSRRPLRRASSSRAATSANSSHSTWRATAAVGLIGFGLSVGIASPSGSIGRTDHSRARSDEPKLVSRDEPVNKALTAQEPPVEGIPGVLGRQTAMQPAFRARPPMNVAPQNAARTNAAPERGRGEHQ